MIRSTALVALALTSLQAPVGATTPQEAHSAHVQVLRGRALLREEGRSVTLMRSQEHDSTQRVELEVGAGSQVEVRWLGSASMQVWGPTSMAWSPNGDGTWAWSFEELAWADLEVRRGEHQLDLPGEWRTSVSGGALHLRGLPSGPVELRHHAGRALLLEWRGDDTRVRPPVAVYAGSSLRLDVPRNEDGSVRAWSAPRPQDDTRHASPPPVEVQVGLAPQGRSSHHDNGHDPVTQGRQPDFMAPERVRGSVDVQSSPGDSGTAGGRTRGRFADVPPLHEAYRAAQATNQGNSTQATQTTQPTSDDPWRGVRASEMTQAGPLTIQRSSALEVRITSAGSWKVLLDSTARGPVWCFGPEQDVRLAPGGVVTFSSDGKLRLKFGDVEVHSAPNWRQPLNLD